MQWQRQRGLAAARGAAARGLPWPLAPAAAQRPGRRTLGWSAPPRGGGALAGGAGYPPRGASLGLPGQLPPPPKVSLRDFSLLKVVGKGSFGKVMQVRKKDTGRIHAMKVLHKSNIVKRNQVEHTRTERNVLSRLEHPFIVGLNYAFQSSEKLYFVLDCAFWSLRH